MTALTADRNTPARAGDLVVLPVRSSAATTIYTGSLVCLDPAVGQVLPAGVAASTAALPVFVGVAEETVINPQDGAKTVRIRCRGVFQFVSALDATHVGRMACALDDQSIGVLAAPDEELLAPVGRIIEADGSTAWVSINDFAPPNPAIAAAEPAEAVDALTGTLTGTANGAMVDIAAAAGACAGGSSPTAGNVDAAIATAVAPIVSGANEQLKELQTTLNAVIAALQGAGLMAPSD